MWTSSPRYSFQTTIDVLACRDLQLAAFSVKENGPEKIASKSSQSVQKRHCPSTSRQSCGQAASGALFKRQNWKFVVASGDLQCSKVESRKTDQRNCLPERKLSIICALHTSGCHALERRDLRRGMNGGGG